MITKFNIFRGDLTDISATKHLLQLTSYFQCSADKGKTLPAADSCVTLEYPPKLSVGEGQHVAGLVCVMFTMAGKGLRLSSS